MSLNGVLDFLGISPNIFSWVILPLLIFFARITDVSINTVRVIFMLGGRKLISTLLGFFESFVWLMAISQILQHLDNFVSYFAYAGGFASGIFVGMVIEDKLAIGNVIVRIITQRDAAELINNLRIEDFRLTIVEAEGNKGPVNIIFLILKRQELERLTNLVEQTNPQAILTVEGIKSVKDLPGSLPEPKITWYEFLKTVVRK